MHTGIGPIAPPAKQQVSPSLQGSHWGVVQVPRWQNEALGGHVFPQAPQLNWSVLRSKQAASQQAR
jgi:hypothetical protein